MLRSCFSSLSCVVSRSSPTSNLNRLCLFYAHHLKHYFHHVTHPTPSSLSLHSCGDLQTLKQIHASYIISNGFETLSIASKLIYLYTYFDDLKSAVLILKAVHVPHTRVWNSIIKSHVDLGFYGVAFSLYGWMRELDVEHDSFTFPIINRAISSLHGNARCGEMVHCLAIQMGFGLDIYFCNTMIGVYARCGCIGNARKLFEEMPHKDFVSWTSMISGFVCVGSGTSAFKLFNEMRMEVEPNSVTVMVMLQACSTFGSVIKGRELHGQVIKKGFVIDGSIKNSVLRMYTLTGSVQEVDRIFCEIDKKDVVSWNILITFYSMRRDIPKVTECFNKMLSEAIIPSIETLTSVISAIATSEFLSQGEMLHCFVIKTGLYDNVLQTSLLDFYAKCWELDASVRLFSEIPLRNNITWSAMMSGFIQNGHFKEAIELVQQMQTLGLELGVEILQILLVAYTHMGALQLGKAIHGYLIRNSYYSSGEENTPLKTSILNMYIKCGNISSAKHCFNKMVAKDIVTWTSMIEGCGSHGFGSEALKLFDQMVEEGIQPSSVTFLSVLFVCSHSGLLSELCEVISSMKMRYGISMKMRYGIEPDLDNFTCVVDLLGRSGKLEEALTVTVIPESRIWGALLASCKVYGQ